MPSDALTALSGGLAGAVLTLIGQWAKNVWAKPKLEIVFSESEPGCRVDTNVMGDIEDVQCYLRLKILNRGRTTAQNVSASVVSLTFLPSLSSTSATSRFGDWIVFGDEVMDLKQALNGQLEFRLVGKRAYRYVDLAHTLKIAEDHWGYIIDVVPVPARLLRLGFGPGSYSAEIAVSADNADTVRRTVNWTFTTEHSGELQIDELISSSHWASLRQDFVDLGSSIGRRFRRAAIDQSERSGP